MEIIRTNINDRKSLNKLGYDSNIYYCGNYSMQKYYSYIYRKLQSLGVNFALNRACFIHDMNYNKKPTLKEKAKIDFNFFLDMIKCIWFEYKAKNINAKHAYYLIPVACLFYLIVVLATPFYIKQGKVKKNHKKM
jgi:hypothetical protein